MYVCVCVCVRVRTMLYNIVFYFIAYEYIDDACGDSPPPPGDPRLGADRSSAGEVREQKRTETRDWGQIGTVRFVAESTGCGQRKYTKIMEKRPRRLPNEALRSPKAAREVSRAAQGPLRALRGGFGVVSRLPLGRKKEGPEKMRSISLYFWAPFCIFSGIFDEKIEPGAEKAPKCKSSFYLRKT